MPTTTPRPGSRVELVEFGLPFLPAVVSRVCENGWEIEVVLPCGGFDFWPIESVRVVADEEI